MILLLLPLVFATTPSDVPRPAADHWVSDVANVLSPTEEAQLDAHIDAWRESVPVEVAVVTLASVDGTPKAFATELFNTWGIGDAETNNGFLLLLVMDERRLEIEIGTGMNELYTQDWLRGMQEDHMVPVFRQGEFGRGLSIGLEQLQAHQAGAHGEAALSDLVQPATSPPTNTTPIPVRSPAPRPAYAPRPRPAKRYSQTELLAAVTGAAGGGTAVLGGIGGLVLWRRRRQCPQCKIPMTRLDEQADDAHLSANQVAEERLGSANWEVRICPQCQFSRTFDHGRWFSGYSRCGSCDTRALTSRSTTLVAATQTSGGQVEVDERCHYCPHSNRYTYDTPMLPPDDDDDSYGGGSSYSSGGSSQSFGGGSSSGGGAGSSW